MRPFISDWHFTHEVAFPSRVDTYLSKLGGLLRWNTTQDPV